LTGPRTIALVVMLTMLSACAPTSRGPAPAADASPPARSAASKRIVAAIKTVPPFLYQKLNPANVSGGPEVCDLVAGALSVRDDRGELVPRLAEAVPSAENGLWQVFPDGRMEMTWRLRENARWHDGTPITAEDLVFTATVFRDPDFAVLRERGYELIDAVEAVDARTVKVSWRRPFIDADTLFGLIGVPMPRHLLEKTYQDDKASLLDSPVFSQQFVNAGPFRLKEWSQGSHVVLQAFDQYALGRPKLDEVEVRFITDDNTLIANILSGTVDMTLGRSISVEQALQVRDTWRDGIAEFKSLDIWIVLYPQFLNPSPAIVTNPQFRKALLHAIDRQELVDSIQHGLVPIADSVVSPNLEAYRDVQRSVPRYEFDVRRTTQLLEELGYPKGPDGFHRDPAGQRLGVQIQVTTVLDIQPKTAFPVADYWQRAGVGVDVDVVPPQRGQDLEYRANFPAFALQRQPANLGRLPDLHSTQARTADRGYTGTNNSRYMDPSMDALVERYLTTIPARERVDAAGAIIRRIADELIWMGLFFDTEPSLLNYRLVNVRAKPDDSRQTWNSHEWSVK
jgi:peptide/nickel transport system substrate-binding protein